MAHNKLDYLTVWIVRFILRHPVYNMCCIVLCKWCNVFVFLSYDVLLFAVLFINKYTVLSVMLHEIISQYCIVTACTSLKPFSVSFHNINRPPTPYTLPAWTGQDNTVMSCLVSSVNRIGDKSRLSVTEIFEAEHVYFFSVLSSLEMRCEQSFVSSRPSFQFATMDLFANVLTRQTGLDKTVQSPIYWGLLKTVRDCLVCVASVNWLYGLCRQS